MRRESLGQRADCIRPAPHDQRRAGFEPIDAGAHADLGQTQCGVDGGQVDRKLNDGGLDSKERHVEDSTIADRDRRII